MKVPGIVWVGVRTERYGETVSFVRDVLGVPLVDLPEGFAWSKLPDTSQLEVFRADDLNLSPSVADVTMGAATCASVHVRSPRVRIR